MLPEQPHLPVYSFGWFWICRMQHKQTMLGNRGLDFTSQEIDQLVLSFPDWSKISHKVHSVIDGDKEHSQFADADS